MKDLHIQDPFLFGEWFDIQWFHSCYTEGLTKTIHERLGYGLSQLVAELDNTVQRFYFSRSEWTSIGKKYLEDIVKNPQILQKLLSDLRVASDKLNVFSEQLKEQDMALLSEQKQIELVKQYHVLHHEVWALGQVVNVLELENSFLTDYLKAYLQTLIADSDEFIKVFQILITPRELSQAQQEERDMLVLAQDANPKELLKFHHKKYSWIHFGWTGPSLTLEYFEQVHRGLYEEGKAHEKLSEMLKNHDHMVEQKKIFFQTWNITSEKQLLFELLEELLFLKAYRMDSLFFSYESTQPVLKKIAQDHYLSLAQVYTLYSDWLVQGLEKGKLHEHEINEIAKYSVRYYDGENIFLLVGQEAKEFTAPLKSLLPKQVSVDQLSGECAFPGVVRGRVCVVNRASEMGKFQPGDILVSNVTNPSLLPIMKKASAFVTNMGGLTCHAAIVARELHVPCIVGTKFATKVFKDGDMVEVDASKGIVRKI